MGFFDKKSTSTTNATSSNQGMSEIDGSATMVNVNGSNNQMLDGGAIAGAFDFAGNAFTDSMKFAGGAMDDTIKFASQHDARQMDTLDKLIDTGGALYNAAASQADDNGHQQKLLMYIVGAIVSVMAIWAFAKK